MNQFIISGSPHIFAPQKARRILWFVVLALLPSMLVSFWYFGVSALLLTAISVVSCVLFEYLIQRFLLKGPVTITDGSAVVTGLLLAFNVPSNLPFWQIILGALVAIGIAKMTFGGLGKNPFNPALIARVFLLVSFPVEMTRWPLPLVNRFVLTDAITGPTSLGMVKEGLVKGDEMSALMEKVPSYLDMFMGQMGGSLGEVSAAAILLGGLFLLLTRVISWHIPISFIGTVLAFTGLLYYFDPESYVNPLFHLLTGGLMLGAFFMATDMVTSPMTRWGQMIFGIGCGVITVVIRIWGAYPEGVSFAILVMNAFVPLINKGFKPKIFGEAVNNG